MAFVEHLKEVLGGQFGRNVDLTYAVSYALKGKPKVGFVQAKSAKEAMEKAKKKKKQVTKAEVSSVQKESNDDWPVDLIQKKTDMIVDWLKPIFKGHTVEKGPLQKYGYGYTAMGYKILVDGSDYFNLGLSLRRNRGQWWEVNYPNRDPESMLQPDRFSSSINKDDITIEDIEQFISKKTLQEMIKDFERIHRR